MFKLTLFWTLGMLVVISIFYRLCCKYESFLKNILKNFFCIKDYYKLFKNKLDLFKLNYWDLISFSLKFSLYWICSYLYLYWLSTTLINIFNSDFNNLYFVKKILFFFKKFDFLFYPTLVWDLINILIEVIYTNICCVMWILKYLTSSITFKLVTIYDQTTKLLYFFLQNKFKLFVIDFIKSFKFNTTYQVVNNWFYIDEKQQKILSYFFYKIQNWREERDLMIFLITLTSLLLDLKLRIIFKYKYCYYLLGGVVSILLIFLNCWVLLNFNQNSNLVILMTLGLIFNGFTLNKHYLWFKVYLKPIPFIDTLCLFFFIILTINLMLFLIVNFTPLSNTVKGLKLKLVFSQVPYIYILGHLGYSFWIIWIVILLLLDWLIQFNTNNDTLSYYNYKYLRFKLRSIIVSILTKIISLFFKNLT